MGHFRRYTKKELGYKISKSGFMKDRMFYFNILGLIGWYITGNLFKNSKVSGTGLWVLDTAVPVLKYVERVFGKRIGLSFICYIKKEF